MCTQVAALVVLLRFAGLAFGAHASARIPSWSAPLPNRSLPLSGFKTVDIDARVEVYHGNEVVGTYNHAVMIHYHLTLGFLLAWKNGPYSEDKNGQRILYSQSKNGLNWTKTDGTNVLFPSLTTKKQEVAMFVGPPIHINGRLYVGASPGIPTGAAQGAQYCLWPDPVSPRSCGPPHWHDVKTGLVMREVLGFNEFGPMFWLSDEVPHGYEDASTQYDIGLVRGMSAQTQSDMAPLKATMAGVPCQPPSDTGTTKCESCAGGCQLWNDIDINCPPSAGEVQKKSPSAVGNERAHYVVPPGNLTALPDVILYRSGCHPFMYASVRTTPGQHAWPSPSLTNIPNDESNLNAGRLPDDRVYLLHNPVFVDDHLHNRVNKAFNETVPMLKFRDPITVATSTDGYDFDKAHAVISCTMPQLVQANSTCTPRFTGGGKNPGPSYPQGLVVVDPAPKELQGFYVANSNNKEDIWLTKLAFGAF